MLSCKKVSIIKGVDVRIYNGVYMDTSIRSNITKASFSGMNTQTPEKKTSLPPLKLRKGREISKHCFCLRESVNQGQDGTA